MSSLPALPVKLSPPLNDREAINDAIYRAFVGIDSNDASFFDSAFVDEGRLDIDGNIMEGREALRTQSFGHLKTLDTTHFVTNTRVNIDEGGSTASATASVLAQHYRGGQGTNPAAPRFLAGTLNWLQFVKDEKDGGLWKIKDWKLRSVWGEGDPSVLARL